MFEIGTVIEKVNKISFCSFFWVTFNTQALSTTMPALFLLGLGGMNSNGGKKVSAGNTGDVRQRTVKTQVGPKEGSLVR